MAKLEAAEQRQVSRAEVASCEQQLEELGNRSSHVLEEAQRSTRYSKLHSDLFEAEAQDRAQEVEEVEVQAQQEINALKRQAELKQLQAQESAAMAAATSQEAQSSNVHAQAMHATAQKA